MSKKTGLIALSFVGSLAGGAAVRVVEAQAPLRQQEVRVPGMDVMLRAGWQLLIYKGCRFAVPVSWRQESGGNVVRAPDGNSLSVSVLQGASWSAHKSQMKAAYAHPRVVHEDNERRLWFEIGDAARAQHYIAVVASGSTICTGLLDVRASTMLDRDDTIKRIADGIGAVPETWPPK